MSTFTKTESIEVSLTSYADYLLKSGKTKITAVRQMREQYEGGYNQGFDYYKKFRDGVRSFHRDGKPVDSLETVAKLVTPESKRRNYEILARGYAKFWARNFAEHEARWLNPVKVTWTFGNLDVRINPEVCLQVGRETYFIKLYNKKDKIRKLPLDVILQLMEQTLAGEADRPVMCVLDVRRSRLFESDGVDEGLVHLLEAEALGFTHLWRSFDARNPESLTQ